MYSHTKMETIIEAHGLGYLRMLLFLADSGDKSARQVMSELRGFSAGRAYDRIMTEAEKAEAKTKYQTDLPKPPVRNEEKTYSNGGYNNGASNGTSGTNGHSTTPVPPVTSTTVTPPVTPTTTTTPAQAVEATKALTTPASAPTTPSTPEPTEAKVETPSAESAKVEDTKEPTKAKVKKPEADTVSDTPIVAPV